MPINIGLEILAKLSHFFASISRHTCPRAISVAVALCSVLRRIRQVFGLPGVANNKGMTTAACFNAYVQNLIVAFPTFRRFPKLKQLQCCWRISFQITAAGQFRNCTGFPLAFAVHHLWDATWRT